MRNHFYGAAWGQRYLSDVCHWMSSAMLIQGNVSALRAAYEARWHSFGQAVMAGGRNLTYAEMPWPAEGAEDIRTVILYGTSTPVEVCTSSTSQSICLLLTHES